VRRSHRSPTQDNALLLLRSYADAGWIVARHRDCPDTVAGSTDIERGIEAFLSLAAESAGLLFSCCTLLYPLPADGTLLSHSILVMRSALRKLATIYQQSV